MLFVKLFTLISFLLLFGCAQKNHGTQINPEEMENIVISAVIGERTQNSDPITIRDVKLNGNILTISVTYSGGCSKHIFSLIGSTNISKSLPPRRAVSLIHQAKGDQCKKAVMEDLLFDLSELTYKKENGSKIWLDLEGWKEAIDYTFTLK